MRLFEVTETGEAKLNKAWLSLIPQFRELFKRTDKKVDFNRASGKQYVTYIYFMYDFTSPIRDWTEDKRHEGALQYSGLTEKEVKQPMVKAAIEEYKLLQIRKCRAVASYRAAQKGLDKMDEYFENIDFSKTDKQGKLLYTPNQYIDNLGKTNKAYDELEKLARRVETELTEGVGGIRGMADLGDREKTVGQGMVEETEDKWSEDAPEDSNSISFTDIGDILAKA